MQLPVAVMALVPVHFDICGVVIAGIEPVELVPGDVAQAKLGDLLVPVMHSEVIKTSPIPTITD